MKEFDLEKIIFDKMQHENLDNFHLIMVLRMHRWCLHVLINSYHSFLIEQFDTLSIQYRHIEHMYERVWLISFG